MMRKCFVWIKNGLIASAVALPSAVLAVTPPSVEPATGELKTILGTAIDVVAGIAGGIAVLALIYGGILYMTGGPKGAENGKIVVTAALTGLAIVILSVVLVKFLLSFVGQ